MSRRLGPQAQDEVRAILSTAEANLFWRQQPIDQRHAYDVAVRVEAKIGRNRDAMAAALLHDIGKTASNLGPIERSLATACAAVRLPLPTRWQQYRDHGAIGAADLERIGASPTAIGFARGERDAGIDPALWQALVDADNE